MPVLHVEERGGRVRFAVRVSPRASRDVVLGVHAGALKIAITAPPVEGAANEAIVLLLARLLHVPKRAVTIVAGASSKQKTIEIDGITPDLVRGLIR